jgi:hypothetical protein
MREVHEQIAAGEVGARVVQEPALPPVDEVRAVRRGVAPGELAAHEGGGAEWPDGELPRFERGEAADRDGDRARRPRTAPEGEGAAAASEG